MDVRLFEDGRVAIVQPDDFRSLRVVASRAMKDIEIDAMLASVGAVRDDTHVWLDPQWLRAGRGPTSLGQCNEMLANAARKGWVDADSGAVRAHLART